MPVLVGIQPPFWTPRKAVCQPYDRHRQLQPHVSIGSPIRPVALTVGLTKFEVRYKRNPSRSLASVTVGQ
jgi:hypothetical protein